MTKVGVGLLGYGVVGQGVAKIIQDKAESIKDYTGYDIEIKRVLEINLDKEMQVDLAKDIFTDDIADIVNDPDIDIVVEVTSALEDAKDMIKKAMENDKHIVTANKAVVSRYYEELSRLASQRDLYFLYEAAVAGGIPIIKPLCELVVQNKISRVRGILNGTCNYILSKMTEEGHGYDTVLKEAQDLGYAEADPTSDVDGSDTLRKLRILSTIAFEQKLVEEDILLEGIYKISSEDISNMAKKNRTIKLIGDAWIEDDQIRAVVQPVAVSSDSYFASVKDAYNSVTVYGDMVGELKFYGSGAGMLPTGNAVVNDIIDIAAKRRDLAQYGARRNRKISSEGIYGDFYIRYNPSKLNLSQYRTREISSEPKVVIAENVNLKEVMDKLKADEDSVIIRLEGEDY